MAAILVYEFEVKLWYAVSSNYYCYIWYPYVHQQMHLMQYIEKFKMAAIQYHVFEMKVKYNMTIKLSLLHMDNLNSVSKWL